MNRTIRPGVGWSNIRSGGKKISQNPLLRVIDLKKHFYLGGGILSRPKAVVHAVNNVSFTVSPGESFGLVGESGCGKSTLGRLILHLLPPTSGFIEFDGQRTTGLNRASLRPLRQRMQIIFQDPFQSLDPRMKVGAIISEPLYAQGRLSKKQRRDKAADMLTKVGLQPEDLDKYPHEFSGGQRQRIGIARALCVRPELVVADEPVSALDVSIQAQVINLLNDLKQEYRLSLIFISHDLSVVEQICDRIGVMYLGSLIELALTHDFILKPRHPYTQALLAAVPRPDPHNPVLPEAMAGDVPSPIDPPSGCSFHPRCPYAWADCRQEAPELIPAAPGHLVACRLNQGRGLFEAISKPQITLQVEEGDK